MKNKLFGKATALVMGSLVLFSSQALAISSNKNQELSNAEALGEFELLIAADSDPLTEADKDAIAIAIGDVDNVLGDSIAAVKAVSVPENLEGLKNAIAIALGDSKTVLGNAVVDSLAVAKTKGDAKAIAKAIGNTEAVIGNAITQSTAIADSPGGGKFGKSTRQG